MWIRILQNRRGKCSLNIPTELCEQLGLRPNQHVRLELTEKGIQITHVWTDIDKPNPLTPTQTNEND